ncbi:MAG: hypothetical protein QM770_17965 [Tepidisphaeraceae bacterium]
MSENPTSVQYRESAHWCDFFEHEAKKESQRAVAIISVSVLDEALVGLLKAAMLPCPTGNDPLFDGAYAPMGSFSAKIDFACRLGLISAGVAQSLHLVRKIRNDFAHDISSCSFELASVRNRVRELTTLNQVAKPERRAQFPEGTFGDFQTAVSWLIWWIWHLVEQMPTRCPECGMRHRKASHQGSNADPETVA